MGEGPVDHSVQGTALEGEGIGLGLVHNPLWAERRDSGGRVGVKQGDGWRGQRVRRVQAGRTGG